MNAERLIRMANSIGDFFAALPDADEASAAIATHVRKFWEPRMRREIYALLDAGQADELSQLVRAALARHRAELLPQ